MHLSSRVLYRARALTNRWVQKNAFTMGILFGSSLAALLILMH
jgi:hypothetical protein